MTLEQKKKSKMTVIEKLVDDQLQKEIEKLVKKIKATYGQKERRF